MADLYNDLVTALLHFDGANGSTSFIDEVHNSFSASGGAVISTTQSKFDGASGYFNGSSYITAPPVAGFAFGANDFTVELWAYPTANSATYGVNLYGNHYACVLGQNALGSAANGCLSIILVNGKPSGVLYQNQNSTPGQITASSMLPNNAWTHVAYVRYGSITNLFINGISQGTSSVTGAVDTSTRDFPIGADSTGNGKFTGYIDEVRITKGVARYTANFTPDTTAFDDPPSLTSRAFLPLIGRQNNEVPNALLAAPSGYNRAGVLGWRNIYQGGAGRVAGTVKYTPNSPVHRKVRLIDEATGLVVRESWSDSTSGAYSFDYVDPTCKYTVLSYDYTGAYRAVVADGIIPEAMP